MKVLSLFDGMACGMLAMQGAGIKVDRYVAFEYDEESANASKGRPYGFAAFTASHNFPMIEQRGDVFKADFTEFSDFDYLVGGSPCTYWSIAQKNNRETEASGMGWELFSQYVRALHEARPKYFIYENNKSMSKAIRESITQAFGFEPICINSALVSAQNRQRLYWVGMRNEDGTYSKVPVDQPEDRGILLRDILETYVDEQTYEMQTVGIGYRGRMENGKWVKRYESNDEPKANALTTARTDSMVAVPVAIRCRGRKDENGNGYAKYEARSDGKANTLDTNTVNGSMVAEPIRVGDIGSTAQAHRVYSCDGKSVTINAGGGGQGGKTGLYLCPVTKSSTKTL